MTREAILDALNRLEGMLENDYIDITNWTDEAELWVVVEAIKEYRENHGF